MNLQSVSTFVLKQRLTLLVNRYEYFVAGADGQAGELVAFVEQKRLALREEITAYASEKREQVVFKVKAEKVMDVYGKYFVRDAEGQMLGYVRKVFGKSLLRSTWEVYDAHDQLVFMAQEQNMAVAIFRRVSEFVPVVGVIGELLPYHFEFLKGQTPVGLYRRNFSLRDQYTLSLEPAAEGVDRRLVMAFGIMLDALQSR